MRRMVDYLFLLAIVAILLSFNDVKAQPENTNESTQRASILGLQIFQAGSEYDLMWNTIAGGGATPSASDGYALDGTIGQLASEVSAGSYTLSSGFWVGVFVPATGNYKVYLPLVLK